MQAMEVKKNGKVEHSANSHDDQVFSYLHALYVWYDGQNLAERYHIIKNVLKTDEDEEIEEADYVDQLEKKETLDTSKLEYDEDSEIQDAIDFVEKNMGVVTSNDLAVKIFRHDIESRDVLLSVNRDARKAYSELTGLDESVLGNNRSVNTVTLPTYLFINDGDEFDSINEDNLRTPIGPTIVGNLADEWLKI